MKFLRSLLFRNPGLKALSLLIAIFIWLQVAGQETVQRIVSVPIVFTNMPAGLEIVGDAPTEAAVVIRVDRRAAPIDPSSFAVVVDMTSARPGEQIFPLTEANVAQRPRGVEIVNLLTSQIRIRLEKTLTRSVAVRPRLEGFPAAGFQITQVSVTPDSVVIVGPERHVQRAVAAYTEPVKLEGVKASFTAQVRVVMSDPRIQLKGSGVVTVAVTIAPTPERR
jgi:YbbR domain-containing protein